MAQLPQPHPTQDLWGEELNEWLRVGHHPDGTNKGDATKADASALAAHTGRTDNPHNTTKDQLGLGNVDNTSDAAKPVSTAQQAALDAKLAKPAQDGVYGQVLTITHSGQRWVDPPGVVYPSLLLSPEGSRDRSGPVSITLNSNVSVVPGRFGATWEMSVPGTMFSLPNAAGMTPAGGTILVRGGGGNSASNTFVLFEVPAGDGKSNLAIYEQPTVLVYHGLAPTFSFARPSGATISAGLSWTDATVKRYLNGELVSRAGVTLSFSMLSNLSVGFRSSGSRNIEAILLYPEGIPDSEIARISNMPTAWTMANTAVNLALQSQPPATPTGASLLNYFPVNRKIAAGGAPMRTAPGTTAPTITTLAAGTDVHSTGQTVTASSVSYTLIMTSLGQGFVPTSALI